MSPVGEQGAVIARTAALLSGCPRPCPAPRSTASAPPAWRPPTSPPPKVASGFDDLVLAGGVESMSRVPMGSDGGALFTDPTTAYDQYIVPQGIGADLIATMEGFSREDVDAFAAESQARAERPGTVATSPSPWFRSATSTVSCCSTMTSTAARQHRREPRQAAPGIRRTGRDGRLRLRGTAEVPERREDRFVHTGGNSSGIVDGAGLVLLGSERRASATA